ncbi:NTE family protein RssA [Pseudovibrio axinellae]|uniref:NTE family protein RssA n=1 Tax=Pseudovibrio axinellae TaxID=989403 RepID=A0A165YD47_9HYPH|nr:patatin-like phospholipase family protein [Pseudovibrio axinellae]KZL18733.1 NTE family protein RssA [Pseudovibrio axinellae]SEP94838.1 NTE family protein [Pseudovibrio axinellae]
MNSPRIGIALGGGGARGLSHIPVLQALDDMGITPHAITGTSIGALIGAAYAGGMSGDQLEAFTLETLGEWKKVLGKLVEVSMPKRFKDLLGGKSRLGQFDSKRVLEVFIGNALKHDFSELDIPFQAIAADYFKAEEVRFSEGNLIDAVSASIAIPFVFKPVHLNNTVLIDGGVVNPLPFDVLPDDCDLVIAVDVVGTPKRDDKRLLPSATESVFGATQILMRTISQEKLKIREPDLSIFPNIKQYQVLDFLKAREILEDSASLRDMVKVELDQKIENYLSS